MKHHYGWTILAVAVAYLIGANYPIIAQKIGLSK